jgi:hypothetical protein
MLAHLRKGGSMSSLQDFMAEYQAQIDRAHDRIRMFESGEMEYRDTFAPFKDWTDEAIARERVIIAGYESGLENLRKINAARP